MEQKHKLKVIGQPVPKIDAGLRVSGKAIYGHDISLPGMLHGAILRAAYPSARFSIDVTEAAKLPGVVGIITANDVDMNHIGYKRDHPVLKKERVNSIRDEIAAVAAETKDIALQALRLIKVEYEPEEGVYDPHEALAAECGAINAQAQGKFGHPNIAEVFRYAHGDLAAEKARSAVVVERRYVLPRVSHACMATSNITAHYEKQTGKLLLYSSTQVPFLYQRDMAHALKMSASDIRVIQPVIGGGFGSKLDMYPFEPICAALSMKTGRPVQILFSREEEFVASPTRQPMEIWLSMGADSDGRFTYREVKVLKDNGAYTSWGATTPFVIMQAFSSLYQVRACAFEATAVYTNNVYAGSFRGYGNPQATFALERSIDLLADALHMDKADIRKLNANQPGDVTGQGLHYATCGHADCLDNVLKASAEAKAAIGPAQGRYRRGIGYASMLHVGGGAKIYRSDGCGTTIKLDPYGYCTVISGSNEIGQGSETVLAMMAAEELGIPINKVKVINTDTDVKPWDVGVHASRTSFVAGNSLLGAIGLLKEKLKAKACELMGVDIQDLNYDEGQIRTANGAQGVALDKVVRELHFTPPHELAVANYFYEPGSSFQDKGFKGNVSGTYAFAAQAIEVEVDTYTGNVAVKNAWVAQDVGKVLNPLLLAGQIQGGFMQGMGYAVSEELQMEKGRVINANFHNYKMLTAVDVPNIYFEAVETHDPQGPYGAKGVGEAPLIPTAAAIANAVCDALGIELCELPIHPERVLRALHGKANTIEPFKEGIAG